VRRHRRLPLLALIAVLAAGVALAADATHALRRIELESVDLRFTVRGDRPSPRDVVVVGVDDASLDRLNAQWPFLRGMHARVMDRLRRDGAKVIGYDVQFTEPSLPRYAEEDSKLIGAVNRSGPRLVLATTEVDKSGNTKVLGDGRAVEQATGARIGNAVMPADPNAVRRRVPFAYQGLKSFAVQMVEQGAHRPVARAPFGSRGAWIDFHGPGGTVRAVPFWRLADRHAHFRPGTFRGKYVVVGAVAASLQDVAPTSTSGSQLESGPEAQAEAVATILAGFPLRDAPGWWTVLLVLAFACAPGLVSLRLSAGRAFLVALTLALAFAGLAQLLFEGGRIVGVTGPLTALALASFGTLTVTAILEAFERQRVRDAFGRFVPTAVVDEVVDRTSGDLRLGGVSRECTVLFSDLRGFTSFSESRPPDQVIDVLNGYLSEMSDAILDNGGTLISYMGDGIYALFGAPLDQPDHRDRALATGRSMLERLERFNAWMHDQELGDGFRMGVGINTGVVMCGNVGSARRLEYTAIGDTVNTASRIEGLTKGTPHQLLMADSTYAGLRDRPDDLVFVDDMAIRGRQRRVKMWGLAEAAGAPAPAVEFTLRAATGPARDRQ
jgi:adenylate cyclase